MEDGGKGSEGKLENSLALQFLHFFLLPRRFLNVDFTILIEKFARISNVGFDKNFVEV